MKRAWQILAAAALAACTGDDVPPERMPRFETPGALPQVALVLGSGGPRGFAHIGVLKVLEENGIRPDFVIGSSVGAMVGALYAGGMSAAKLEKLAHELNVMDFFLEVRLLRGGPASGRAVQNYVNDHVNGRMIEQLPIGFGAAVTRLSDHRLTLFNRGDTGLAVRASGAIPGQFEAVRIGAEYYVDGDESSPVPIRAARALGAKVVIAVDVSAHLEDTPPGVPQDWVVKDERRARQVAAERPAADVFLHPNIGYYAGHNEEYRRRVIDIAERFTREHIAEVRAALRRAALELPDQKRAIARIPAGEASR